MPDTTPVDIPYERQTEPSSNRMCGAAALSMVYRSFGIRCSQAELWARLTDPVASTNVGARSYLLANDALSRGLSALVLRAKDPLRTLENCHVRQLRAILNHRPRRDSSNGHFTVLVDFVADQVVVHDPLAGPNTHILKSDLLELWQPLAGASEITGNVLVVVSRDRQSAPPCHQCGKAIPETIDCPGCGQSIALRPASVLGCITPICPERAWETLFCPRCDAVLMAAPQDSRGSRGPKPSETGSAQGSKPQKNDDDPMKIVSLNQEIDKFLALLLSVNHGRPVPGAEQYFTAIRQVQTELLDLQKQQAAELRAKPAQPPPPRPPEPAPAPKPAPPPEPVAAEPPPRPPVDWNELARKLIEEIGVRPR
jgi:Peptidase C39 family